MTTVKCWIWRNGWRIAEVTTARKWAWVTTADGRTKRVLASTLQTKPLEPKETKA